MSAGAGLTVESRSGRSRSEVEQVVNRFAGDSGNGIQLTGDRFTQDTAAFGNDLSTLPNLSAEIRAPQGTIHGVSSFQLYLADHDSSRQATIPTCS